MAITLILIGENSLWTKYEAQKIKNMTKEIIVGVDIGGSHITSAGIELSSFTVINDTKFTTKIDNKGTMDAILRNWAKTINLTIDSLKMNKPIKIAFAMPGPFDYERGIALFEVNDKYEKLYDCNISNELPKYIVHKNIELRFINDASAFGIGITKDDPLKKSSKIITLTLGTGLGAAFIKNGIPLFNGNGVPDGGLLWDKPFKDSIADDYLSSRWCIQRYKELSGKSVKGVKEIADSCNSSGKVVFREFGVNLGQFLATYLLQFNPDTLVLGGNISKAHEHFLPFLKNELDKQGLGLLVRIAEKSEDNALVGACMIYDPFFINNYSKEITYMDDSTPFGLSK